MMINLILTILYKTILNRLFLKDFHFFILAGYRHAVYNRRAYTLFEVLVALIIIGIAVTAVVGGLSGSKRLSAKADHTLNANRILNNLLCNPFFLKALNESETMEKMLDDEPGWRCRATSEPLVVDSAQMLPYTSEDGESGEEDRGRKIKNKASPGEEIEIPGMRAIEICISDENNIIEKEYCVFSWIRE